uniref:Uncharacterized protein n=1 Tax=Pithovirus LCPAC101 TaxID=2506586 RepID=A0A481Z444_9VIRU|nr:MAG: hypothetical protein LCPAC101_00910 [Pithovirus LCPAC101]
MSGINCFIGIKIQKVSSEEIKKILNLCVEYILFIPLVVHFYHNPLSLYIIDEIEIANYLVMVFSSLVFLNIFSLSGLFQFNSDSNPKSQVYNRLKCETILSFISVMGEESLFLPLYSGYYIGGLLGTQIILSIIFGLLHIPGRTWKSGVYIAMAQFILLQFNFSLINKMIGHYLYDIILLQML